MYKRVCACLLVLSLFVAACGGSNSGGSSNIAGYTTGYTPEKPGTLKPGDSVPPPTGDVVLTITGKISVHNVGDRLDLDMNTLERLDQVSYATNDAGIRRRATYRGILLKQVLDLAGIAKDATTLQATALDDYQTELPLTVLQWPVMLATFRDGVRMAKVDKGPMEIVFPYDGFNIDPTTYDPKWVWMLRKLEVR
jgi:hypothetical protein